MGEYELVGDKSLVNCCSLNDFELWIKNHRWSQESIYLSANNFKKYMGEMKNVGIQYTRENSLCHKASLVIWAAVCVCTCADHWRRWTSHCRLQQRLWPLCLYLSSFLKGQSISSLYTSPFFRHSASATRESCSWWGHWWPAACQMWCAPLRHIPAKFLAVPSIAQTPLNSNNLCFFGFTL